MGTANLVLRDLLRLLTPEEITELTNITGGRARVQLTELMEKRLDEESLEGVESEEKKVKSLSIGAEREEVSVVPELNLELEKVSLPTEFEVLPSEEITEFSQEEPVLKGTQFILSQKDRFKGINKKLKEKHLIRIYRKNSSFDIEQEKANRKKEDKSLSSNEGILINKRHF